MDVPAVAVTLNTNDFGDVRTFATLAQVKPAKKVMGSSTSSTNANLVVVSGTNLYYDTNSTFLHGCALADFAIVCGNLPGVSIWAPVQDECSLGTLDNAIDQTMFLDEVFVNSLEYSYTTGANATENYGAETDNKMWLLNDGRFVNFDSYTLDGADIANGYVELTIASGTVIPVLSTNKRAFLRKDDSSNSAGTWFDSDVNAVKNIKVVDDLVGGVGQVDDQFTYDLTSIPSNGTHRVYIPVSVAGVDLAAGDTLDFAYAADAYGTTAADNYFTALSDADRPDMIGALRQGQAEVYIVDPTASGVSFDIAWRLTGCTITSDLTREPLAELGHLSPYDRPLTMPIPITVTVDSTAGDLETWAKFARQKGDFDDYTLDDIDLADLMSSDNLKLVVKVFAQTDEEAAGTGSGRTIMTGSELIGRSYFMDGVKAMYASAGVREYALKTVIVEHLKITDEGSTLDMGANATQTFGFRSTNDLYIVKGDISVGCISGDFKVRRNAKY